MLKTILTKCDERHSMCQGDHCEDCSYMKYCPQSCEKCLDYIHNPSHAPAGSGKRKYDCTHMADVYTCKYSCRYTSEIVHALKRCEDIKKVKNLRVLSFGCGPCTDLFAIDYLRKESVLTYNTLEYRGVDYSEDVWKHVHKDVSEFNNNHRRIRFYYEDMCKIINIIAAGSWMPDLIVFQYVFSDMEKHTDTEAIKGFISTFSRFYNEKIPPNTYIIINDVNLGTRYGGGREHFDEMLCKLDDVVARKGRFCNDNASYSNYYTRGYPYGNDSDGEFPSNMNFFDWKSWKKYSPFDTCASAQMLIKKVVTK